MEELEPMSATLDRYFRFALGVLRSEYNKTTVLNQSGSAGTAREQIVKDFLSSHLPDIVKITAGEIIDFRYGCSSQQDIVVVLKSMPRLPFANGIDLLFVEGVLAVIEAKTRLDKKRLAESGGNLFSVRQLVSTSLPEQRQIVEGEPLHWPTGKILTVVIAFEGSKLGKLEEHLEKQSEDASADLVLVLERGALVRNQGHILPKNGDRKYLKIDSAAEGLKVLMLLLAEITSEAMGRKVDLRKYATISPIQGADPVWSPPSTPSTPRSQSRLVDLRKRSRLTRWGWRY